MQDARFLMYFNGENTTVQACLQMDYSVQNAANKNMIITFDFLKNWQLANGLGKHAS